MSATILFKIVFTTKHRLFITLQSVKMWFKMRQLLVFVYLFIDFCNIFVLQTRKTATMTLSTGQLSRSALWVTSFNISLELLAITFSKFNVSKKINVSLGLKNKISFSLLMMKHQNRER